MSRRSSALPLALSKMRVVPTSKHGIFFFKFMCGKTVNVGLIQHSVCDFTEFCHDYVQYLTGFLSLEMLRHKAIMI